LNRYLLSLFLLAAGPTPGQATVLFADDFSGEPLNAQPYVLNYTDFANWNVLAGSVDLVDCNGMTCVDLDGSTLDLPGAVLETKAQFNFTAGRTYRISFAIPQGTDTDSFDVTIGNLFSQSFAAYTIPLLPGYEFTANADLTAPIRFTVGTPPDYLGPYITNVVLSEVAAPEPSTWASLGLGLLALRVFRRYPRARTESGAD
jgi:hypothetical protein